MSEQPLEQAMDPCLFSLSKGPSLIDYTVTPPACDMDLEFCLTELLDLPRKGAKGCFCFPIAYMLVRRAMRKMQGSQLLQSKEQGAWVSPLIAE